MMVVFLSSVDQAMVSSVQPFSHDSLGTIYTTCPCLSVSPGHDPAPVFMTVCPCVAAVFDLVFPTFYVVPTQSWHMAPSLQ